MAYQRWTHSNKSVFNIGYHLIWCPKYRRKVLVGNVECESVGHISEETVLKYIEEQKNK